MARFKDVENTDRRSKKIALTVLAVTAIICSRTLFFYFDDPEGPNLLIVLVLAAVVYVLSLVAYLFVPIKTHGIKRLLAAVFVQVLFVMVLYFGMR